MACKTGMNYISLILYLLCVMVDELVKRINIYGEMHERLINEGGSNAEYEKIRI